MNWGTASIVAGLLTLAWFTWPAGVIILAGMAWVWWKS